MILPAMKEVILVTARQIDRSIININGDQKWHQLAIHIVNLERYGRQTRGMERLQVEIEVGTTNIKLVQTPQ